MRIGKKKPYLQYRKANKITIMKKFEIILKNLKNDLTMNIAMDGSNISEALHKTEALCKRFEKHGILLKITLIYEIGEY